MPSGEREPVTEFDIFEAAFAVDHPDALANVPNEIRLKHALAGEVAKLITERVESAFGGVALASAVLQGHAVLVDHCDEVAVESHQNLIVLGVEVNRGVALAPTLARSEGGLDCLVHLGFDFTHDWLNSFDSYSMAFFRGKWGGSVTLRELDFFWGPV